MRAPAEPTLFLARTVPRTGAEGPHLRFAIWLAGCSLRCPGCCNPELFDRSAGRAVTVRTLARTILETDAEGLTVVGGEPLEQLEPLARLCEQVAAADRGVIVFTGYRLEEARARPGFEALWSTIDTLVDGRFDARQPERDRRWLGSANQRLHHRTPRYAERELWSGSNSAEVRVAPDGSVSVHGFPDEVVGIRRALSR